MYSKTFGIFSGSVLCSAVSGPKEKAAAYFMLPLFSHLEDLGHSLSGFLLSTIFSVRVLFIIWSTAVRMGPLCSLLLIDWRSDLGLTCVSCQSKPVKMALLTWPLKPAPGLGGTTGLTLLRFVIMGEHWFTVITGLLWFLQNLYSVTITWLQ